MESTQEIENFMLPVHYVGLLQHPIDLCTVVRNLLFPCNMLKVISSISRHNKKKILLCWYSHFIFPYVKMEASPQIYFFLLNTLVL